MAERFPLIANSSANQIQEIASGDSLNLTGNNVHNAGIITATSFKGSISGGTVAGSTGTFSGDVTVSGNLGVAGTITYEDVARVDATGISTFREGFGVGPLAGIALTAYKDGSIRTSGIITATQFKGDGSNLTSLPAQATIANNADNRVITGGSGVNLNGEANLTYDGNNISQAIDASGEGLNLTAAGNHYPEIEFNANRSGANNALGYLNAKWNNTAVSSISFNAGSDTTNKDDGYITFNTRASGAAEAERLRIGDAGQIGLSGANYGTAGQVLTSGGASAAATWAAAGGGKLKGWAIGTSWYGTTAGANSSNKIEMISQAYTPTDANSNILIFVPIEIDARTASYADQIRIEGVRDGNAQHARWLVYGNVGNSSGSILSLLYVYKPTGWSAGSSSTFKVRLWSEGSSGSPSDQYNVRVHESSYYLLAEFGP